MIVMDYIVLIILGVFLVIGITATILGIRLSDKEFDEAKSGTKLYKTKIKFYLSTGYQRETINVAADSIEEAIDKIHSKYDQDMNYTYSHPAIIIKIKRVK